MNREDRSDDGRADIAAAFHDAVGHVMPRRGVDDIAARVGEPRDSRGRTWAVLATVAAIVLVTGGVAWLNHQANKPEPAPATSGRTVDVLCYYLGHTASGPRLFSERHTLHEVTATDLQAAVTEALGTPDDPDYRSGFPAGTTATATDHGDHVTVDFHQSVVTQAPTGHEVDPAVAIQALVWTATAALDRPVPVDFEVNGTATDTLLGRHLDGAVRAEAADDVMSPVSINLAEGAQVPSGTIVGGQAATFEGTVIWQLRQGEQVVRKGFTTANQCCTLSPYLFRLVAPPGSYTLVVRDSNASSREGVGVTSDTKDIVIQ